MIANVVAAQRDANWLFGDSAWVAFDAAGPIGLSGSSMVAGERSASISDHEGTLLFYTNGDDIWNAQHDLMLNGPLNDIGYDNQSCTEGVMILPSPSDSNQYYVISNPSVEPNFVTRPAVSYSVVDMALDDMKGGVVDSLRYVIIDSVRYTEKLGAVRHANGRDWWVLMLEGGFEDSSTIYHFFLIDSMGFKRSHIQEIPANDNDLNWGEITFSNNGDKLVVGGWRTHRVFHFDRCSGMIGEVIYFDTIGAYGSSFSPDDSKVYVVEWGLGETLLYQYDLTSSDRTEIRQMNGPFGMGQIQRYQDKLYVVIGYAVWYNEVEDIRTSYLHVINKPNDFGLACDFDSLAVALNGGRSWYGLPNIPNYELGELSCDSTASVGLSENLNSVEQHQLRVYPNPADSYLLVDAAEAGMVRIVSPHGITVSSDYVDFPQTVLISTATLPPGLYQLRLEGRVQLYSAPLLIVR